MRSYIEYHWYRIVAGVRHAFGWCPGCPRRRKQGHKMDCSYGWNER